MTRDEYLKRGIISGLDTETDQLNGSGFSGVPVGTIQADTLTPNGPVTGRRITGVGTGVVTRNFTPPGAINQAVVSEGAARIAAANRQPLGATAQELQERLARMLPDTIAKANERRRLRGMSDVERNEEIENIELANRVNQALGLAEPTQEQAQPGARRTGRRVNISDATGPTLDGPMNAPTSSAQAKAYQAKAIREFTEELGNKLASTDKSAWQTEADYQGFIDNLETVKKYGDVIGGTIYHYARSVMPKELAQKFKVTDMNQQSFTSWFGNKTVDFNQDGMPDTAAVIFHAAQTGDTEAARFVSEWRNESDAPVYVLGPNGEPMEDPYKQAQITARAGLKQQGDELSAAASFADARKAADIKKKADANQKRWDASPALQKAYPEGVDHELTGDFIEPVKDANAPTIEQDLTRMAQLDKAADAIAFQLGVLNMNEDQYKAAVAGAQTADERQSYVAARSTTPEMRSALESRMNMIQEQYKTLNDRYAPKKEKPSEFETVAGAESETTRKPPSSAVKTFSTQAEYDKYISDPKTNDLNDGDVVSVGGTEYTHFEDLPKDVERKIYADARGEVVKNQRESIRRSAIITLGAKLGLIQARGMGLGGIQDATEAQVRSALESTYAMTPEEIDKTIANAEERLIEQSAQSIVLKKRKTAIEEKKRRSELSKRRKELLGA